MSTEDNEKVVMRQFDLISEGDARGGEGGTPLTQRADPRSAFNRALRGLSE